MSIGGCPECSEKAKTKDEQEYYGDYFRFLLNSGAFTADEPTQICNKGKKMSQNLHIWQKNYCIVILHVLKFEYTEINKMWLIQR